MRMNSLSYIFKNVVVILFLCLTLFSSIVFANIPENTVRIHYNRADGSYNNWRLYPWGRDLNLSKTVTLQNSMLPSGVDRFGIYFDIPVKDNGLRFGYFIHHNGRKSAPVDIKFDLRKYGNEVWQLQSASTLYAQKPNISPISESKTKTVIAQQQDENQRLVNQGLRNSSNAKKVSVYAPSKKAKVLTVNNKAKVSKKTGLEIEQDKLTRLLEKNTSKERQIAQVQSPSKKEDKLIKVQSEVKVEALPIASINPIAKDEPEIIIAASGVLTSFTVGKAALANKLSTNSSSNTKSFPIWIWLALAMFALVPGVVFVLYKKQISAMADDSNSSVSRTLAKSKAMADATAKELIAPDLNIDFAKPFVQDRVSTGPSLQSPTEINLVNQEKVIAIKPKDISAESTKLEATIPKKTISSKATIDNETGLPNKALFVRKLNLALDKSKENDSKIAIMFIDFDGFKKLNCDFETIRRDMFKSLVARFKEIVDSSNVFCRLEKDCFVVTCEFNGDLKEVSRFAQKLVLAGTNPLQVAGETLLIDTTVGISIYPDDEVSPNALLEKAGESVARAKEKGGNRFQFVSEQTNAQSMQRIAYESSLRNAIDKEQLLINYQPIVETQSQNIVGVEALVRWQHPDLGLIGPAQFIHVAEEAGIINDLGMWVLRTACEQASKWHQKELDLQLSVNISNKQLQHAEFYEQLCQVLEDTNFPADYLTLDLQESVLLENSKHNQVLLERIHQLGVQISIDDFGTGQVSLVELKKYPIDEIKIDRSFIRTVQSKKEDAETTAGIIALAHNLNIHLVAEGVELQGQREFLIEQKCERMQGSLFCEAKPAAILTALLKQRFQKVERVAKKLEVSEEAKRFPKGKHLLEIEPKEEYNVENIATQLPTKRA